MSNRNKTDDYLERIKAWARIMRNVDDNKKVGYDTPRGVIEKAHADIFGRYGGDMINLTGRQ